MKKGIRKVSRILCLALCVSLIFVLFGCASGSTGGADSSAPFVWAEDAYPVEITAINVGKADSILVRVGERHYLIDTATKDEYEKVPAALSTLGITSLDGVFLTHTDKDHGGGMKQLAQSDLPVGGWYAPVIFHEKKPEKHQAAIAAEIRGEEVNWLSVGDVVAIDEQSFFEVLAPQTVDRETENNNSLVLRLTTPGGVAIFTGDMELPEAAALMNSGAPLKCDYLKVSNHGDSDATSAQFAAATSPQIAVISTSTAEKHSTPDPAVVAFLEAAGATVYVTQDFELGVRVALSDGRAILIGGD